MQQRLVDLFTNIAMIEVDQQYNTEATFAGGRIWSRPPAQEMWAKPLLGKEAAVVLFNRGGLVIGTTPEGADPPPPHCSDPESTLGKCTGCYVNDDRPWLSPCDDNATASTGAQTIAFRFADLPPTWLGLQEDADVESDGIRCELFDIFATAAKVRSKHRASSAESVSSGLCLIGLLERRAQGAPLGSFADGWSAVIPPHGVRFLKLGNCTTSTQ